MSFKDKDWRVRIDDMLEALCRCLRYTDGMNEAAFTADHRTIDAVARNLEIIGEAANKVPDDITAAHPMIPWAALAEIRHILIHEYHSVDAALLYRTVRNDLPPLQPLLLAVLGPGATPPTC
ncbi:HepT-like ribonuclease domain-containing protein [Novispirillum itersonii]|uniref:Uncharacterized protein with HEPN domain n=1 Tax=Novispirillum itersonii TaxID=189 RepID=A0A7W9ZDJ6_NOVIT|nr:DUF86 domain-containing protein [Novispirillum itersonii]MBB6209481.1 uncharacterized protein with HEPN domain [Novispirillum itersonii]